MNRALGNLEQFHRRAKRQSRCRRSFIHTGWEGALKEWRMVSLKKRMLISGYEKHVRRVGSIHVSISFEVRTKTQTTEWTSNETRGLYKSYVESSCHQGVLVQLESFLVSWIGQSLLRLKGFL